jgi:hypothetical protein
MSTDLKTKIPAYLQLVRLPNIFTAIADIIAGYFLIRIGNLQYLELFGLIICTSAIYGAGCVYNDLCDLEIDTIERPFRPIPSGKVTPREAGILSCVLFAIGLGGAALAGIISFLIAFFLIVLVVLYDRFTKDIPILGSLNMALCRGGNLFLGMSPAIAWGSIMLIFPVVSIAYVFSLTTLSKFETGGIIGMNRWVSFTGFISVGIVVLVLVVFSYLSPAAIFYLGLMAIFIVPALFNAFKTPDPSSLGKAVKMLVLGIPLLDAVYVSGIHGIMYGIPVVLCLLPAILISRFFYVT